MPEVVEIMRKALQMLKNGNLSAPTRKKVFTKGDLFTYTVGAVYDASPEIKGWRAYLASTPPEDRLSEITVVYNKEGNLRGIILGKALGEWRTGAIGGLAIDLLAPLNVKNLGVIGTGAQSFTQILAALSVRNFESVQVISRNLENCNNFVREIRKITKKKNINVASHIKNLVEFSDVLICAASSPSPVFKEEWLKDKVHINNIGGKTSGNSEISVPAYKSIDFLATDSLSQLQELGEKFVLGKVCSERFVIQLSDLVYAPVRGDFNRTMFISQGLAGTEVILANELIVRS